jgi:myosin heavy subunit
VGGSIINYLLEKSRIPWQQAQERNYHIFYQLLAGAELDLDMKRRYKLKDAEEFHYMNQSGVTTVDTINDEKDWLEMSGAMDVLNMTPEEKECVFRLIAGVLHLGNVEFEKDPKGSEETDSKIKNPEQFKIAAELFRVDGDAFAKTMCFKKITRPGSKSVTYARYSIVKATDARDATSKSLYGKLFDWLICMINKALSGIGGEAAASKDKVMTIGVLDIFGFESFATNSFEQLCINYCNEKCVRRRQARCGGGSWSHSRRKTLRVGSSSCRGQDAQTGGAGSGRFARGHAASLSVPTAVHAWLLAGDPRGGHATQLCWCR